MYVNVYWPRVSGSQPFVALELSSFYCIFDFLLLTVLSS